MNLKTNLHVLFNVMKKILLTTLAMVLPFLAISCADYGTYGYGTVTTPVRSSGSSVIVGGGLAPLQVGFVATSFDRWAWDPYRRHYFDRSCRRYWNPRSSRILLSCSQSFFGANLSNRVPSWASFDLARLISHATRRLRSIAGTLIDRLVLSQVVGNMLR